MEIHTGCLYLKASWRKYVTDSLSKIQENLWSLCSRPTIERYYNDNGIMMKRSIWFAEYIKKYELKSAFEIGLMGGRNIEIIKKSGIDVGGIDINAESVSFAQEKVSDGKFYHQSVYDLNVEEKYDLVFSVGVFIHIPHDRILDALKKCVEKANCYVIHLEATGKNLISKGPEYLKPRKKISRKFQWRPDLVEFYKKIGIEAKSEELNKRLSDKDVSHITTVKI